MMRTFLITAATLGLLAGSAVAQDEMAMADGPALSLSGSAGLGATFTGEVKKGNTVTSQSKTEFNHFAKVTFKGAGVTDGGLTFGMKVRVNGGNEGKVDDAEVHIGGESWTLTVGDNDPASDLAYSLGDVGFDGNLGVDDVAEKFHSQFNDKAYGVKDAAQARLDLTFGVATIGVSVGQTAGKARVEGKDAVPAMWQQGLKFSTSATDDDMSGKATFNYRILPTAYFVAGNTPNTGDPAAFFNTIVTDITFTTAPTATTAQAFTVPNDAGIGVSAATAGGEERYYAVRTGTNTYSLYRLNDNPDKFLLGAAAGQYTYSGVGEDTGSGDDKKADTADTLIASGIHDDDITDGGLGLALDGSPQLKAAQDAVTAMAATKQKTNWTLGTKFDLGVAKLGLGIDSEKKLQASVGGDFGQFGGSLFYAQQDVDIAGKEHKLTGLGAEFKATVQEGTTLNVVATQADMDMAGVDKVKGFGAGVKHALGGGATLEAGFAQVKDVNKASVGVTMAF